MIKNKYSWKLRMHYGQVESADLYSVETGEIVYIISIQDQRWEVYSWLDDQIIGIFISLGDAQKFVTELVVIEHNNIETRNEGKS